MKRYCQQQQQQTGKGATTTLSKALQDRDNLLAKGQGQSELQPVYRSIQDENTMPVKPLPHFNFGRAQLDGTDLSRCRIKRADWAQFSAKGAILLSSDLRLSSCNPRKIRGLSGANISYSRLVSNCTAVILPRGVSAIYITLSGSSKGSNTIGEGQADNKFKVTAISNDKQLVLPLDKGTAR